MAFMAALTARGRSRGWQKSGTVTTFRPGNLPRTNDIVLAKNGDCPCFFAIVTFTTGCYGLV
jgi:hypothetical protein